MNVSVIKNNRCFGCGSCFQACPKSAITMKADSEGFYFPDVDTTKCIDCSICVKKCPSLSPVEKRNFEQKTFSVIYKNEKICLKSASGGAFASFAMKILDEDGVVFGCAYNENLIAIQTKVEHKDELVKLQGSKYVSSNTEKTFIDVKDNLLIGRKVLYSGRSCQIAGLRKFLEKDYDNLLTVDLVCHGVPSELFFQKYLEWLGKKTGGKIIYYGFRDKDVGGWTCGGKFKTKTKTKTKTLEASCDPYYSSFLRGETYRFSCYECPFANTERVGDISICDFWGVEKFYPKIDTSKGISGIIANSEKGENFFEKCRDSFEIMEIKLDELKFQNTNLNYPTPMPEKRKTVYKDCIVNGCFVPRVEYSSYVKLYVINMLSKLVPKTVKKIIKKILRRA